MRHPFFVFLGLLLAAGCRTGKGDGPTMQPVVISTKEAEEARPRYRKTKPPEWFDQEIAAIELARQEGRIREALEMVYEAREYEPGSEHALRLESLLRELNQAVLDLDTVHAWVEVIDDPIAFGDPLRIRIHMRNPGTRPVRVPAQAEGTSRSLFILRMERREYDVRAQIVTTKRELHTPMTGDIEIPPQGTAEQVVTILDDANSRGLDGFRIYTVGGILRPTVVEVGGLRRWEKVPIRPASLRSFRPNYEHLGDDPVARIEQALEKTAGVHLLTASALVPMDRRSEAVDRLVDALRGDRPIDWAIFASLQYLTNVELGRDAAAWKAWWPRVRETYFAPPPPPRDPDTPVFDQD